MEKQDSVLRFVKPIWNVQKIRSVYNQFLIDNSCYLLILAELGTARGIGTQWELNWLIIVC